MQNLTKSKNVWLEVIMSIDAELMQVKLNTMKLIEVKH